MTTRKTAPKQGFALVIALSLMAFVLLLLLSITTLTHVETQQASQQKTLTQARQNASAAVMMAIGQLQKTTGPDQRVTATAEILEYDNRGTAANAPYFTGVWATDTNYLKDKGYIGTADDPQLKPATVKNVRQPISWLVSEMDDPDIADALTDPDQMVSYPWDFIAPTGDDAVLLFDHDKDPSTTPTPEDIVLTRQAIDRNSGSNPGHYAWWVGDEGVKASLQLDRNTNNDNDTTKDLANINVFAPPTQGIGNIVSFDSNKRIIDQVDNYQDFQDDLIKAADYNHIQLIAEGSGLNTSSTSEENKISRDRFHDFTLLSRGVLSNVRDGGLKRDLSAAFADDNEFNKLAGPGSHTDDQLQACSDRYHSGSNPYAGSSAEYQIFPWPRDTVSGSSGTTIDMLNPGGPMWEQLRSFYQLTMRNPDTPKVVELDIDWDGTPGDDLEIEVTKDDDGSLSINEPIPSTTYTSGIHPVISHYQQFYHPYFYQSGSTVNASLLVIPTVVIWNPSNVTIEPNDFYFMIYKKLEGKIEAIGTFESTTLNNNFFAPFLGVDPEPTNVFPFGFDYKSLKKRDEIDSDLDALFPDTTYAFRYILQMEQPLLPGQARIFSPNISKKSEQVHGKTSMEMDHDFLKDDHSLGYVLHEGYRPSDFFYIKHERDYPLTGTVEEVGMFIQNNRNAHNAILGGINYTETFKRPYSMVSGTEIGRPLKSFNTTKSNSILSIAFPLQSLTDVIPSELLPVYSESHSAVSIDSSGQKYYPAHGVVSYPRLPGGYATDGSTESSKNLTNINPTSRLAGNNLTFDSIQQDESVKDKPKNIDRFTASITVDQLSPGSNANQKYLSLGGDDAFIIDESNIPMGYSDQSVSNTLERWVVYDLPANASYIQSIANLSEARLTRPSRSEQRRDKLDYDDAFEDSLYGPGYGILTESSETSHPIGNSYSAIHIPSDVRHRSIKSLDFNGNSTGEDVILYDTTYELNDALWDGYFFSTYTATQVGSTPTEADLRHPRLNLLEDSPVITAGLHESAGHLMTVGAFNVNSTSIAAWEAVLASALGQSVETTSKGIESNETDEIPFPSQTQPYGSGLNLDGADLTGDERAYEGYPVLNNSQITALADKLVDQVKKRGPFLSMSHFVNRVIQKNDHQSTAEATNLLDDVLNGEVEALLGALQSAIDLSGLNSGFETEFVDNNNLLETYKGIENELEMDNVYGSVASGSSGYLTQDKILKQLGSTLQVRSDTFKIRAYGDTVDPINGTTTARAWCEVVVQRRPEYLDGSDEPHELIHTTDSNLLVQEAINKTHGRRYEILSWRWLSENEL